MIRALLFDMDGLILDTEPIHFLAFRAFLRAFGFDLPESAMGDFVGYDEIENIRDLKEEHHLPGTPEELVARRRAIYLELVSTEPLRVFPGFWELSEAARRSGLKQGVVSSSIRPQVEIPLRRMLEDRASEIRSSRTSGGPRHNDTRDPWQYFDVIVTGDDVSTPKPAPDPYRLAVQRLGLAPDECVAFEDTPPGVASAAAAGVTVYAVPNEYSRHLRFPGAQAVLGSLADALEMLGNKAG